MVSRPAWGVKRHSVLENKASVSKGDGDERKGKKALVFHPLARQTTGGPGRMLPRPSSLLPLQRAAAEDATLSRTWTPTQLGQEAEQWWAGDVRPPLWIGSGFLWTRLPSENVF